MNIFFEGTYNLFTLFAFEIAEVGTRLSLKNIHRTLDFSKHMHFEGQLRLVIGLSFSFNF